jgi:hypothetical protein
MSELRETERFGAKLTAPLVASAPPAEERHDPAQAGPPRSAAKA